jgi:2-polyprenyl-3-methyl-5-hydroxy-6-metoxy-1,4-benzoquinol methylase
MDPLGKKELITFYNWHLTRFGDDPRAVRWTHQGQFWRYRTLLRVAGDLSGKSVLDFGCGKGDLYGYMQEKGIPGKYCGIDVNEKLITLASRKHPGAEFIVMDIEEHDIERQFDVVLACGVFNLRIAGIEESLKNLIKKLFRICRHAVHLNLLNHYIPVRNIDLFYVKPEEIMKFVSDECSRTASLLSEREDLFISISKS